MTKLSFQISVKPLNPNPFPCHVNPLALIHSFSFSFVMCINLHIVQNVNTLVLDLSRTNSWICGFKAASNQIKCIRCLVQKNYFHCPFGFPMIRSNCFLYLNIIKVALDMANFPSADFFDLFCIHLECNHVHCERASVNKYWHSAHVTKKFQTIIMYCLMNVKRRSRSDLLWCYYWHSMCVSV